MWYISRPEIKNNPKQEKTWWQQQKQNGFECYGPTELSLHLSKIITSVLEYQNNVQIL